MKSVRYHSDAESELADAASFYEKRRDGLGKEFTDEVIRCIGLIQEFPGIGSQFENTIYQHLVVERFPYAIFYAVSELSIWIVAVAHGSRSSGYWLDRRFSE